MNTLILVFALLCAASAAPQFASYNKLNLKFAGPGAPPAPISLRPIGNAVQPPRPVTSTRNEVLEHGDHIHRITEKIEYPGGGKVTGGKGTRTGTGIPVVSTGVKGTPSVTGLGANLNPSFRIAEQPNNGQYDAILKQEHALDYDGTYRYNFDAENGISLEEHGGLQNIGQDNEAMAAQGFYSYTGPDGVVYTVTYIADENGFQPQGVHIPR